MPKAADKNCLVLRALELVFVPDIFQQKPEQLSVKALSYTPLSKVTNLKENQMKPTKPILRPTCNGFL
jgi:hypothetical protein